MAVVRGGRVVLSHPIGVESFLIFLLIPGDLRRGELDLRI